VEDSGIDEMFEEQERYRVDTKSEAWEKAEDLENDLYIVEYGIKEWPRGWPEDPKDFKELRE
jgi:hypothetical protein